MADYANHEITHEPSLPRVSGSQGLLETRQGQEKGQSNETKTVRRKSRGRGSKSQMDFYIVKTSFSQGTVKNDKIHLKQRLSLLIGQHTTWMTPHSWPKW